MNMKKDNEMFTTNKDRIYLSVDIVESTRLIDKLDAESASELLEKGLQVIADAIYKHGGKVIYTAGDGAVAEFKTSAAVDNPLLLAISAGLDIQSTSLPYQFRVGIDCVTEEQIKFGKIAYTIADAVQKYCPPGKVAISQSSIHYLDESLAKKAKPLHQVINDKTLIIYQIEKLPVKTKAKIKKQLNQLSLPKNIQKTEEEYVGEIKLISIIFIKIDEEKNKLTKNEVNTYLEDIKKILKDYGATMIKGNRLSIMTVVGAPISYEDHAIRACMIAHRVLDLAKNKSLQNKATIGIHSGPAVMDNIGGKHFHQYDAMGATISYAARLEQFAKPGQALISEQTKYLAGDSVRVKKISQLELKGFKGIHTIYSLENVVRTFISQKLEWQFYNQQIFIDHVAEIQLFEEKLALLSSQAVVWGINAEPGVGKSRLSYEFSKIAEKKDLHVLTIAALSYQVDLSFSLIRQFFSYIFNIETADSIDKINLMLTNAITHYSKLPPQALSALFTVFGFQTDDSWQKIPQKTQLDIIGQCMYEIIVFHANHKPIFLTLDDMHWADNQSLTVLLQVCDQLLQEPVFILMCFRPEFHHTWQLFKNYETTLSALSAHDSQDFMNQLLHGDAHLDLIKEKIIRQSDGNPFYMEEIVRFLINNQVLIKKGNKYHLQSTEIDYQIPDTIQGVISGSIDRLSLKNKQLLQQASILGFVFSLSDLQMLSERSDQELALHLNELQEMGLLFTKDLYPHTQYSFKHAYIMEVTYQMMLTKNRIKYHTRFVQELEKQPDLERKFGPLAYHSFQAKLWLKSFIYYFKIIPLQINILFPINRILKDSKKAEEAYQQLSQNEQDQYFDNYATIKMQQLHAIMASGRPDLIFTPFQELEKQAAGKHNHFVQALAMAHLSVVNALLNNFIDLSPQWYDNILPIGAKAMEERDDFDKDNFLATLYFPHIISNYIHADYELLYVNCIPMLEKLTVPNTSSIWLGLPIWSVSHIVPMMGLFDQMKLTKENSHLDELINAVINEPPTESTANNQWALGMAYFFWGDLKNAKKRQLLSLEDSKQIDLMMFQPVSYSYLAFIAMIEGEHDKASLYAKTAYEISKMIGHMFFGIISMGRVANVLIHYAHLDLVNILLDECLPIVEKTGQKCRCIELYQAKADYLIASQDQPDIKAITDLLIKAELLIDQIGALFYYPFVQRSFAKLYQKLGQLKTSNEYWQNIFNFYDKHPSEFWRNYFYNESIAQLSSVNKSTKNI